MEVKAGGAAAFMNGPQTSEPPLHGPRICPPSYLPPNNWKIKGLN